MWNGPSFVFLPHNGAHLENRNSVVEALVYNFEVPERPIKRISLTENSTQLALPL